MRWNWKIFWWIIISIILIILIVWILPYYLVTYAKVEVKYMMKIQDELKLYGTFIGITISIIGIILNLKTHYIKNRKNEIDNTPTISIKSDQKISINNGFCALYLLDPKIGKEKEKVKSNYEIWIVCNNAGKRLLQFGTTSSFELKFQSPNKIKKFIMNSLNMYYWVNGKGNKCIINYLDEEKRLFDDGWCCYGNMKYNRILKFNPYKDLNVAKPYIKDDYFIININLIYQAVPIIEGHIDYLIKNVNDFGKKVTDELRNSNNLVFEMNFTVINEVGLSNKFLYILYYQKENDYFKVISYEIKDG